MICKNRQEFRKLLGMLSGALSQFANSLSSHRKFVWGIHQDIPKEKYLGPAEKNRR